MIESHVLHRACADLGDVAHVRDVLQSADATRRDLDRAVGAGMLVRLRPGWVAVPEVESSIATAVRHGGALGCVSRLQLEGLWLLRDHPRMHVAMRPNGRARSHPECACVAHWNDAPQRAGRVSLVTALSQALGCLGIEEFFIALESAMRKRRITRGGLASLRSPLPLDRRWLADFARWNADSGLESLLRLRLRGLGIDLASQVAVPGVGTVDFVLGDRLILEVDGKENHDGSAKRHKDLVRDAVAASHGFDTLRFDYAMVVHEWELVEAAILSRLDRSLHLIRHRPPGTPLVLQGEGDRP
ncbi:endonuclease domain-containing protein [Agromyces sp. M3QZ16-3]|uniref:endonuclease domain-containing protein n=1 Tax=Agromyces sp. M3QZ16-3 TaxID=3447585 RepID=UPI003F68FF5C